MSSVATFPTTGVWDLDPTHSTVGFRIKHHAVGTFRGNFTETEAKLDAGAGKLTGSVQVGSVTVFDMLKDHLLADDFLDAAKYPAVTFESTAIKPNGDQLTVEGNLTLKGVTKPVTATGAFVGPSKVAGWDGAPNTAHIGVDLEIVIDRRDFDIDFNNELLDGQLNLGWDVTLDFSLELVTTAESV